MYVVIPVTNLWKLFANVCSGASCCRKLLEDVVATGVRVLALGAGPTGGGVLALGAGNGDGDATERAGSNDVGLGLDGDVVWLTDPTLFGILLTLKGKLRGDTTAGKFPGCGVALLRSSAGTCEARACDESGAVSA